MVFGAVNTYTPFKVQGDPIFHGISHVQKVLIVSTELQKETTQKCQSLMKPPPHQRVPPEIMANIFTYCVENEVVRLQSPEWCSILCELGHICARWREIVLAEPFLWRRIDVRSYFPLSQSTLEFLHEILTNRGGSCPVELQIMPGCNDDWKALLDLFSTYSSRLRSLQLTINAWNSPTCLQKPMPAFDHVETVALNFYRPSYASDDIEGSRVIKAFSTARRLRKVGIYRECAYNPNLLDITSFPWARLTHLTISCISTSAISRILCACNEICELVIGLQVNSSDCHILPANIRLDHLRSINIQFGANCDVVLDRLTTPELTSLAFGRWAISSQRCISELVERSDCELELLHYPVGETPDIISLLQGMPYLQVLVVPTTDPISKECLEKTQSMNLSPKLHTIAIPVSSICSAVRFLQNRSPSVFSHRKGEGIQDAKIRMAWKDFAPDKGWFEALKPELEKNGCTVEVVFK
ncbi:hypothetical protein BDZ94DRAFT_65303 [Collybia nuda]|uniref:F-box domain-containing protein n=1 Tax=Collybia nuda TaxID=64659 RepID=A0A9P6CFD6_9AGAR|nr:hypothetical protein BDZ94DRAFT_65303 [Collybia nuda]